MPRSYTVEATCRQNVVGLVLITVNHPFVQLLFILCSVKWQIWKSSAFNVVSVLLNRSKFKMWIPLGCYRLCAKTNTKYYIGVGDRRVLELSTFNTKKSFKSNKNKENWFSMKDWGVVVFFEEGFFFCLFVYYFKCLGKGEKSVDFYLFSTSLHKLFP